MKKLRSCLITLGMVLLLSLQQCLSESSERKVVFLPSDINATVVQNNHSCIVFAKFHKVASTSLRELLLTAFRPTNDWWVCRFDPYSHDILKFYAKEGKSNLLKKCLSSLYKNVLPDFTILLREPVERLASVLLFGMGQYHRSFSKRIPDIKRRNEVLNVVRLLSQNKALNITVADFRAFTSGLTEGYMADLQENKMGSLSMCIHTYEVILGRQLLAPYDAQKSNTKAVTAAIENLQRDYDIVGLTEHMPSFYTLFSRKYNLSLSSTCDKHITRNTAFRNMKLFGAVQRPTSRELFSADVIAYIEQVLFKGEIAIYEAAKKIHVEQLAKEGLTIESAEQMWRDVCPGFENVRRIGSNVNGALA